MSSAGVALTGKELSLSDLMSTRKTVFQALIDSRERFGGSRTAIVDADNRALSYDEMIRAALALGHALKKGTSRGEAVGVMLPTSLASILSFFAVSAFGRVPTMMNFTSGAAGMLSATRTAVVKRIITARKFIDVAKLDGLAAEMSKVANLVYLEDVRSKLSVFDKAVAGVGQFMPKLVAAQGKHNSPAMILFTSGTEGEPKGVALSHSNILVNIRQAVAHEVFYPNDVMFNPMPTFHCFGLVGVLLPLFLGIKSVLHPTPLRPHEIVKRVKETAASILLTTDTFISQYARVAEPGDLKTLRFIVAGAERLREETRRLLLKKHSLVPVEGYGLTETSPIAAANQPGDDRPGCVGRLLPGMQARLEPAEGIPDGGRLFLKGPNVMLGYIKPDKPGVIEPVPDGWHDTGDVASIDEEGIITIKGRLKRFANVGGEIVSLSLSENCASAVWSEYQHASVAIPDDRKGEQIVLLTTKPEARRTELIGWAQSNGMAEIALPRRIYYCEEIPVLGTGKPDYRKVEAYVLAQIKAA